MNSIFNANTFDLFRVILVPGMICQVVLHLVGKENKTSLKDRIYESALSGLIVYTLSSQILYFWGIKFLGYYEVFHFFVIPILATLLWVELKKFLRNRAVFADTTHSAFDYSFDVNQEKEMFVIVRLNSGGFVGGLY